MVEHETARYKEEYADGKAANDTKKCYEIKEEREIAQLIVSIGNPLPNMKQDAKNLKRQ